jgi:pimeloyl-ACP methyl ester carboxylesterase
VNTLSTLFTDGLVEINRNHIYYQKYINPDAQETLVLLHGFLSSSFCYRKLIPFLKKDFNIICVDLPPFGKSGKHHHYKYSYSNIAKTVLELVEYLGFDSYILIGHSMGGQIALNMMIQKPERVKKGILLCCSGYLKRTSKPLILSSYIPFFHRYVKYYLGKTGVKRNVETVVYDQALIDNEMLRGYEEPFLEKEIFHGLTKFLRDREGDLSSENLMQINTPCLFIWGKHDRVVPLPIGERLAKDLPHSHLVVLEDAGHLVPEEKPEEVFRQIKSFIS